MKSALLAIAAFGTAVSGIAAPARAETPPKQIVVGYGDLDLGSKAGQVMLEKRIKRAARLVCGLEGIQNTARIHPHDASPCYRQAKEKAATRMAVIMEDYRKGG